jgi:hypothetical protein
VLAVGHGANVATDIGQRLATAGAPDKKAKMKKAKCWAVRGACAPKEAQN